QGRGPHRGRGYKTIAPGRGGRPQYSPLMQGRPQHFRPQGYAPVHLNKRAGVMPVPGNSNNSNSHSNIGGGGPAAAGLVSKSPGTA
ncbi:unnamed protein product, partial [Ectocarpus sp. 4 AP-2014]